MTGIILLGGSPTAGKSYTARKLAEALKLPWISTDTIRELLRKVVNKKEHPALFLHEESSPKLAVKFLTSNSAKEIVRLHNKENKEVWKGVKALIETDYVWKSFIIEGVAILPRLAAKIVKKNKNVKAIFLIDEERERVRKTIFTRGLWDEANKYPDSVKEKEVDWVFEFNNYIKKEAKKYKLPVVSVRNRKNYIKEIKKILK